MIATVTPPPAMAEATTYAVPALENLSPQANMLSDAPPHSPNQETLLPPFLNSIAELKDFSGAMSGFLQRYDDLHSHLQSIKAATLALLPPQYPPISHSPPQTPEAQAITTVEKQQDDKIPSKSELEGFCKAMCSRGVRKYLVSHLSNLPMLQNQVPKALILAPNPWKLVLECLGKFFLQGSKAFARDSPMIPAREASILVLECFLLMRGSDVSTETNCGILDIEKAVKEEADVAALAWRKRLVIEGGLARANRIDARGLLLFVACFGVPAMFQVEDMRDLVIAGNAKEIVLVLQKSHLLMSKLSEIVEEMMKKKMEVDAVDIVYTFGLEERFNPHTILISFLREAKKTWKMSKKGSQGSPATLNEANKKQLDILKSIRRCLERHNIDAAKLLPGWQINEKIVTLEQSITGFDRKSVVDKASQKRKSSETETSTRPKFQDAKRVRHVNHGAQQQKATVHVDSRRSLSGLLPEGMISSGVGATSHGSMLPTYALQEPVLVDATGQLINRVTHPYSWQRESSINERYTSLPPPIGLTSLYRASSSVEGLPGNTPSSVGHGIRGSTSDLYQYRASSSVEGLSGNPTSSVGYGIRGSASDLYQFADSVAEGELYPSNVPRSSTAGSSVVPPHLSSYLYQA
ncbi:protein FRIGIDA-like isoform X2 [Salvia splendens]|uniref:protein FRIGIDA-like isoform X2 n=1 Tax=Salvia splendens TaxID=180675 RepID=UPI001C2647F3|nr:protein FRIGIDA-like isoform X2 [Salvia splendens]